MKKLRRLCLFEKYGNNEYVKINCIFYYEYNDVYLIWFPHRVMQIFYFYFDILFYFFFTPVDISVANDQRYEQTMSIGDSTIAVAADSTVPECLLELIIEDFINSYFYQFDIYYTHF